MMTWLTSEENAFTTTRQLAPMRRPAAAGGGRRTSAPQPQWASRAGLLTKR